MKRILTFLVLPLLLHLSYVNAKPSEEDWHFITKPADRWSFIAEMGLSELDQMQRSDGLGLLSRLALHGFLLKNERSHRFWGFELGLQSGLSGNVDFPASDLNALGGTIQATTRASFDFLASVVKEVDVQREIFCVFSVGGMWRQLFFNLGSIPMVNKVSPEVQFGFSKHVNAGWELGLLYQGVYGRQMHLNRQPNGISTVNTIPSQNGVLFSIYGRV